MFLQNAQKSLRMAFEDCGLRQVAALSERMKEADKALALCKRKLALVPPDHTAAVNALTANLKHLESRTEAQEVGLFLAPLTAVCPSSPTALNALCCKLPAVESSGCPS